MLDKLRPIALSCCCCAVPLIVFATACTGDAPGALTRGDSLTRFVENTDLAAAPALNWAIDTTPVRSIGGGAIEFGNVVGVTRLSDGRIVVLDGKNGELKLFAADAKLIKSSGRRGGGPGEFENAEKLIRVRGDTLIVVDRDGTRVQVFSPELTFIRIEPQAEFVQSPGRPRGMPKRVARFNDGSYLLEQDMLSCLNITSIGGGAISIDNTIRECEDSAAFRRALPSGTVLADYGAVVRNRIRTYQVPGRALSPISLLPNFHWAADGERWIAADGDSAEVRIANIAGNTTTVARMPMQRIPYEVNFLFGEPDPSWTAEQKREAELFRDALRTVRWPKYQPAFSFVAIDGDGDIWLRPTLPANAEEARSLARTWWILNSSGQLRGVLTVPEGFLTPATYDVESAEFGRDYILAVNRDRNDVQQVRLFSLKKN